jgi:site-specific DNA-cytosine methylase
LKNSKKYNSVDLFCGAGGMSSGFIKAGFNICLAIDSSNFAIDTYRPNHKSIADKSVICDDIGNIKSSQIKKMLSGKKIGVIYGAPPCKRDNLYKHFIRFIRLIKPDYFVIEIGKHFRQEIEKDFNSISPKYFVENILLDTSNFGIPLCRERVYFFGNKIGERGRTQKAEQSIKRIIGSVCTHVQPQSNPKLYSDPLNIKENANITIRKAAKIHSFKDDFIFLGPIKEQFSQVINAVPPRCSYIIAEAIYNELITMYVEK